MHINSAKQKDKKAGSHAGFFVVRHPYFNAVFLLAKYGIVLYR